MQDNIIKTDSNSKNGQDKCPLCGSTDISLNENSGKLRCNFCRHEFEFEKITGIETNISNLNGNIVGSGTQDITSDNNIVTLKCSSCGSEVVIDTSSSTQARCHWCRNILSINEQIPNGSIPDVVLPFSVKKEEAKHQIEQFVGKRKFFANPKFKNEFTTENIMGVYFPYMVVDINSHALLKGQGEHEVRRYTRKVNDHEETYYDADLYNVEREFDLVIHGLTIESSSDKLTNSSDKTNNVINAIMPFDIENCVKFNSNYLRNYTSEKRDTNLEKLSPIALKQAKDIARFSCNNTLNNYDRGVAWSNEQLSIKGQQWISAYLPVWLYSYQEVKKDKKVLHYVAVNARTKETMGSVPIHFPKLIGVSFLVELLGFIAMLFVDFDYNYLFLSVGVIYFLIMFARYRNSSARHYYETETKTDLYNLRKVDTFVTRRNGLSNSMIHGANNRSINGSNGILDSIIGDNSLNNIINKINKDD